MVLLILLLLLCYNDHHHASGFVLQSSSSKRQYENGVTINRCSYGSVSGRDARCYKSPPPYAKLTTLLSSPLDDFLDSIFGNNNSNNENQNNDNIRGNEANNKNDVQDENEETMNISSFKQELAKRQNNKVESETVYSISDSSSNSNSNTKGSEKEEEDEFDGYALRDAIYDKYGECFDVDFQRVDVGGFRNVYLVSAFVVEIRGGEEVLRGTYIWGSTKYILVYSHIIYIFETLVYVKNIMPFRLGGKRFRHETEYDYLCHLQAVVSTLPNRGKETSVLLSPSNVGVYVAHSLALYHFFKRLKFS